MHAGWWVRPQSHTITVTNWVTLNLHSLNVASATPDGREAPPFRSPAPHTVPSPSDPLQTRSQTVRARSPQGSCADSLPVDTVGSKSGRRWCFSAVPPPPPQGLHGNSGTTTIRRFNTQTHLFSDSVFFLSPTLTFQSTFSFELWLKCAHHQGFFSDWTHLHWQWRPRKNSSPSLVSNEVSSAVFAERDPV